MISQIIAAEHEGGAFRDLRQHGGIPCMPFGNESVVDILVSCFQIRALHWVSNDVEEEIAIENLQVFEITVAERSLPASFVAPEELAWDQRGILSERWQQAYAVWRELRVSRGTGGRKQRRHPIHADRHLIRCAPWRNVARP